MYFYQIYTVSTSCIQYVLISTFTEDFTIFALVVPCLTIFTFLLTCDASSSLFPAANCHPDTNGHNLELKWLFYSHLVFCGLVRLSYSVT